MGHPTHDKLATVRKSLSCEQFAQIAHDKRANEFFLSELLIRSFIMSDLSKSLTVAHLS